MGPLRELLATGHRQALEFFVLGLQDVSEATVDRQELVYNASVLAHYAQVSTYAELQVSAPANLTAVFDHFVFDTALSQDPLMLEHAGTQCLVLAGFFEDQMRRRHNIRWYAELGAAFFRRAAVRDGCAKTTGLTTTWLLGTLAVVPAAEEAALDCAPPGWRPAVADPLGAGPPFAGRAALPARLGSILGTG